MVTHSCELSLLSDLYPRTPLPTALTSPAPADRPSPVYAIQVYVPPVIAHPVSVLFPPTHGEHDAQSRQSSPPGVIHDPYMPINVQRRAALQSLNGILSAGRIRGIVRGLQSDAWHHWERSSALRDFLRIYP